MKHEEPAILINGQRLTDAQAMSVRVAVSSFLMELADEDYRRDLGPVADGYRDRLSEVQSAMFRPAERGSGEG